MAYAFQRNLNHSMELTQHWITELDDMIGWEDKDRSFRVLRATLHELRDILSVEEAAQLSAQMPLIIKGLFFEEWNPGKAAKTDRHSEAFVARVKDGIANQNIGKPEKLVTAVFTLLNCKISAGEIKDVRSNLREHLQHLWPEA